MKKTTEATLPVPILAKIEGWHSEGKDYHVYLACGKTLVMRPNQLCSWVAFRRHAALRGEFIAADACGAADWLGQIATAVRAGEADKHRYGPGIDGSILIKNENAPTNSSQANGQRVPSEVGS